MKPRGRPKKIRKIQYQPRISQFSPRGKPGRPDEVVLTEDAFEAVRLCDHLELDQTQAAKTMGISQQTLSRVLKKARKVIADAIANGKIIKIQASPEVKGK